MPNALLINQKPAKPRWHRRSLLAVVCLAFPVLTFAQTVSAQPAGKSKNAAAKQTREAAIRENGNSETLSSQDEQAALTFAAEHHAELHDLLKSLRKANRPQYKKALGQLHVTRVRLSRMTDRTPERFKLSLEQWKVDSRIRLLIARMTMSQDAGWEATLETLLARRVELRLALLKNEQQRLQQRMEKLANQIEQLQTDPSAATEKELAVIRRSLGLLDAKTRKPGPMPSSAPDGSRPAGRTVKPPATTPRQP